MSTPPTPCCRILRLGAAVPLGLLLAASVAPACTRPSAPAQAVSSADADGTQAVPLGPVVAPAQASLVVAQPTAFVLSFAVVRREPSDAREIAVAGQRRKQANALATLYRGEQVQVLQTGTDWLRVRLSDERCGWVKTETVLLATAVRQATVLHACHSFTRPDLLALNGGHTLEPGTLLFVLRDKDAFSEVNYGGGRTAWLLTAWLLTDAAEVDAAKLLHRARLLQQRHDPAATAVIHLARTHFSQTRLMQALLEAAAAAAPVPEPAAAEGLDMEGGAAAGVDEAMGPGPAAPVAPAEAVPAPDDGLQLVPRAPVPAPPSRGGAPGLQDSMPLHGPKPAPAPMPEPDPGPDAFGEGPGAQPSPPTDPWNP